jgi:protein-tyrosine phosphatase
VTFLWLKDHLLRLVTGMSPPATSRITPGLYVGGQHYPHGLRRMADLGITASLNLRETADDRAQGVALKKHLWLPTTDDTPPTPEQLDRASAFIGEAMGEGLGVYIHCMSGVGRAATTAAAYLIRPFVRPSDAQLAALEEFHARHTPQGRP